MNFSSWYFVAEHHQIFVYLTLGQVLLYVIQQGLFGGKSSEKVGKEGEANKQLRILANRLSSSVLIFAVIKSALDHSRFKNDSASRLGAHGTSGDSNAVSID